MMYSILHVYILYTQTCVCAGMYGPRAYFHVFFVVVFVFVLFVHTKAPLGPMLQYNTHTSHTHTHIPTCTIQLVHAGPNVNLPLYHADFQRSLSP